MIHLVWRNSMKELVTKMCKEIEFKVRPSLCTKRKRRGERGDRKCPARCRVKWTKLLKNWLQVWGLQIVSCVFNANQRGLLSLNWSEPPKCCSVCYLYCKWQPTHCWIHCSKSYLHLALCMPMHLYHQKGRKLSALTIAYIAIWSEIWKYLTKGIMNNVLKILRNYGNVRFILILLIWKALKNLLVHNFLIGYCAFVRLVIIEISGSN